jgi:hypothetical protein
MIHRDDQLKEIDDMLHDPSSKLGSAYRNATLDKYQERIFWLVVRGVDEVPAESGYVDERIVHRVCNLRCGLIMNGKKPAVKEDDVFPDEPPEVFGRVWGK